MHGATKVTIFSVMAAAAGISLIWDEISFN
jgi:hypothetical protein